MFLKERFILGVFAAQILFAFLVFPLTGIKELFPFATWRLFAKLDKEMHLSLLTIKQVDNKIYQPPVYFYDFFSADGKDMVSDIHGELDQIVNAYYHKPEIYDSLVRQFEKRYFKRFEEVQFQIVEAKVDQFDFYFNDRKIIESRVLGEFVYKK